ncbi:unnamed protein product [Protopolystoma xenopodis]|uniref:Fibronectin type-III domain-containing protein n=1 Tax=Protopolystoma xenopodis TaxID=117903 RepID=A0A3S5C269_9PLAT|nr:unnamed protein product [Protopolystoma xenopodis]
MEDLDPNSDYIVRLRSVDNKGQTGLPSPLVEVLMPDDAGIQQPAGSSSEAQNLGPNDFDSDITSPMDGKIGEASTGIVKLSADEAATIVQGLHCTRVGSRTMQIEWQSPRLMTGLEEYQVG